MKTRGTPRNSGDKNGSDGRTNKESLPQEGTAMPPIKEPTLGRKSQPLHEKGRQSLRRADHLTRKIRSDVSVERSQSTKIREGRNGKYIHTYMHKPKQIETQCIYICISTQARNLNRRTGMHTGPGRGQGVHWIEQHSHPETVAPTPSRLAHKPPPR